jgi:hypothetical protein
MQNQYIERVEGSKPRPGCWLFAVPVIAIMGVFVLYGYMLYYGFQGRLADGDLVELTIETCAESEVMIQARVAAMGLPVEHSVYQDGRLSLQVILPVDSGVADGIPDTLVSPSRFVVYERDGFDDAEPIFGPDDFLYAGVRLTMTASPATFVVLKQDRSLALRKHMEEHPYSGLRYELDGQIVGEIKNIPSIGDGQIEIIPRNVASDKELMEVAAARGITINDGPLPCQATVVSRTILRKGTIVSD